MKVNFTPRPRPIFPSYRPMLRLSQILLTLKLNCNSNKASLLKLHLFSWGYKEMKNLLEIKDYVTSNFQNRIDFFGIEPSLNRALIYAKYEGLVDYDGAKYFLTSKGILIAEKIAADDELFPSEKPILKAIGKNLTEKRIDKLHKLWKNA